MTAKHALLFSSAVVIPLSLLQYLAFSGTLFYVLFPGSVVSLLITGGHGGTHAEELIAPVIGATVNIAFYWLLIVAVSRVRNRIVAPR